jgi:hypothetical protein
MTSEEQDQAQERSKTDWRREGLALIQDWKPCALPAVRG